MLGANLSRQTLSNWVIGAADAVTPTIEIMKEELLKSPYVQADETTLQVIEDNGKESKSKKYMWLYKTGGNVRPIIIYDYQKLNLVLVLEISLETFLDIYKLTAMLGIIV